MHPSALAALVRLLERPLRARPVACDRVTSVPRTAAIVVLGAGLDRRDRLSSASQERVEAAGALWRLGGAPRLVTTGGRTRGARRSEAEVMAEQLVMRGVPREVIACEDASLTTDDNARQCAALLLSSTAPGMHIWLVTQPFHGRRASYLFSRAGFSPLVWPIADSIQYSDPLRGVRWTAREYLAWLKVLARG